MYQENDLYKHYKERLLDGEFSSFLPDVTTKITLNHMNSAINLCKRWNSSLDIGSGNGHYLAGLSSKFKKNIGVEIDKLPNQKILEEKYKNINFLNIPIENYSGKEKFDFIILMDLFEHIHDIKVFMAHISKLQDKDGILYIVTPNPLFCGPAEESAIYYKKGDYHGHVDHYTKDEIIAICEHAGYKVEFYVYEETKLRDTLRRYVKGISRRDQKWSKLVSYQLIRPFALFIINNLLFSLIEKICFLKEKNSEKDIFNTRSFVITLKKK
jgi:SAM-dependent methyltransferase